MSLNRSRQKQKPGYASKLVKFVYQHKLFFFMLLLIMSGGLIYIFSRNRVFDLQKSTKVNAKKSHAQMLTRMQYRNQTLPVCAPSEAPLSLEQLVLQKIEVDSNLTQKIGRSESQALIQLAYQILMDNAMFPSTKAKLMRVFNTKDFKFLIKDMPEVYGAGGNYNEDTNTITVLYHPLKIKAQLHGILNHELHHADCHHTSGNKNNDPFTNDSERAQFKRAIEQCDAAITHGIYELMIKNARGTASQAEHRQYNREKNVLKDYRPVLQGTPIQAGANVKKMQRDLQNGKPVIYDNLHVTKIEYHDNRAIAWGYHTADFKDPEKLVLAFIQDNQWHQGSVRSMYAEQAQDEGIDLNTLVLVERDAEIHASPKAAEFFCPQLTAYHRNFRQKHYKDSTVASEICLPKLT